jgi:hypothetical protein
MKAIIKFFLVAILISAVFSCKKNQIGGKAKITGMVLHHNKPIPNAYVYIKYNSTEFPGDDYTLYDTYVQADAGGNYSISFYKGSYFLYASGLDMEIPAPYIVKGGLSVSIRNKEHLTKDIAVTEN